MTVDFKAARQRIETLASEAETIHVEFDFQVVPKTDLIETAGEIATALGKLNELLVLEGVTDENVWTLDGLWVKVCAHKARTAPRKTKSDWHESDDDQELPAFLRKQAE